MQKVRKSYTGVVVSDKMEKTIVVELSAEAAPSVQEISDPHQKVKAHDERNEAGIGDTVRIVETRPLSKDKHHRLVQIVEKAR